MEDPMFRQISELSIPILLYKTTHAKFCKHKPISTHYLYSTIFVQYKQEYKHTAL